MNVLLVILLVLVVVLVLGGILAWRNRPPAVQLPDEWCDECGQVIRGDRCRIVQQGAQSEDGISGGWAMSAYYHPSDACCPLKQVDPTHVHAGPAVQS